LQPWLTIVGIGEDGVAGLGESARDAIREAAVLVGGERHLGLIPERPGQRREPWPKPFDTGYAALMALRGQPVCVLASGDPMLHGVGATLSARLPLEELRILPAPSSASLAAARLGWPLQSVRVIAVHARPLAQVHVHLHDNARLLIFSADAHTPARVATLLTDAGFGPSRIWLLEHLGGPTERQVAGRADEWREPPGAALNLVAVHCRAEPDVRPLPRRCALPDSAYRHDGQLTKRDIRAATLARLAPLPGELLWDVGAGCGSIGIEWMRADDGCRAIAIEQNAERCVMLGFNKDKLGVPDLVVVEGRVPEALDGLDTPDAIFIGGGLTVPGVAERCWEALRPGGRLVATAVTVQSEVRLVTLRQRIGGELSRVSTAETTRLGRFDGWRMAMPITLLSSTKPSAAEEAP
jgi:precorrin-6Y C5,15-methyltransferase (decarboxylating)